MVTAMKHGYQNWTRDEGQLKAERRKIFTMVDINFWYQFLYE